MSKDFNRIRGNLDKLFQQDAPADEIREYMDFEGVTPQEVVNYQPVSPGTANVQDPEVARVMRAKGQDPLKTTRLDVPGGDTEGNDIEDNELLRAALEKQFNAPVDLSRDFGGNLSDLIKRADLSRSDNPEERLFKMQKTRPDLESRLGNLSDKEKEVFVRPTGTQEPFIPIDAPSFASGSFAGDVADVAGGMLNAETLVSTLPNLIPQLRVGGAGLNILKEAFLGALGSGVDTGIETARGVQTDPLDTEKKKAGISGVFGAGGEAIGRTINYGANVVRGAGLGNISSEAKLAQRFAQDENLTPLSAGQLSDDPLIGVVERQSAKISPRIPEQRKKQSSEAIPFLEKQVENGNAQTLSDIALNKYVKSRRDNLVSRIDNPGVSARIGGEALESGVENYKKAAKEQIDRSYEAARNASRGTGGFDISNTKKLADEIDAGVLAKGGEEQVPSSVIDPATGEPVIKTKEKNINVEGVMPAELKAVISDIKKLEDNIVMNRTAQGNFDPFEQIKSLRTRLFDLKNPPLGQTRTNANRQAARLYDSLTDSMKNPIGGNAEFIKLSKDAARQNAEFEDVLEKSSMQTILKSGKAENVVKLVDKFAAPGNFAALETLSQNIPKKDFNTFRDAFKSRLASEPDKILSTLDDFAKRDPDALNILLTKGEQASFNTMGRALKRLEERPAVALAKKEKDIADRGRKLFNASDRKELVQFINAGGSKAAQEKKNAIAASLVGEIVSKAGKGKFVKGTQLSRPQEIVEGIRKLEDSGKLDLVMSKEQIARLKNLKLYQSFIGNDFDAGNSIQAASLASAFTDVGEIRASYGMNILAALADRLGDGAVGKILINPRTSKYLMGRNAPKSSGDIIRNLSVALSLSASNVADSPALQESEEGK